jgi:hypothetical protein
MVPISDADASFVVSAEAVGPALRRSDSMTLTLATTLALMSSPVCPPAASSGSALRCRGEFTLAVRAPFAEAIELFGAHGESVWAGPDWNPRFLDPVPPHDQAGAVYLMRGSEGTILGYTTDFDREAGHLRHVFVRGANSVTVIDIRLVASTSASTKVTVVYERTALHPGAEPEVRALAAQDEAQAKEWEDAIAAYLKSRPTARPDPATKR